MATPTQRVIKSPLQILFDVKYDRISPQKALELFEESTAITIAIELQAIIDARQAKIVSGGYPVVEIIPIKRRIRELLSPTLEPPTNQINKAQ